MTLRWRQPRITDAGYLAWLREQRCACGCLQGPPCDAAHVRSSSLKYNKRPTGFGERPDDRWALPLKHAHHMSQHDYGDELGWWQHHGVKDVFRLCLQHYERYRKSEPAGVYCLQVDFSRPKKQGKLRPLLIGSLKKIPSRKFTKRSKPWTSTVTRKA